MLRVVFLARGERFMGFRATGHAGFGAYGRDIVCAGASALLMTAAMELERLGIPARTVKSEGLLMLRIRPRAAKWQRGIASILLRSAYTGLEAMTKQYGKHIQVKVKRQKREV